MIVPEKVMHSQVIAACMALGLDPDRVRSFSCNATEKRIRAVVEIPGLPDTVTGQVDIPVEYEPCASCGSVPPAFHQPGCVAPADAGRAPMPPKEWLDKHTGVGSKGSAGFGWQAGWEAGFAAAKAAPAAVPAVTAETPEG